MTGPTTFRRARALLSVAAPPMGSACALPPAEPASSLTAERQVVASAEACVAAALTHDEAAIRRPIDDRWVFNLADGATSLASLRDTCAGIERQGASKMLVLQMQPRST